MAEALPVKIKQGTVNVAANYQLQITNEQPQFSISQGKMSLLDVSAQMKNNSSIEYLLPKVELTQLNIAWPEAQASFDNLLLQQPQIKDIKNNFNIAPILLKHSSYSSSHSESATIPPPAHAYNSSCTRNKVLMAIFHTPSPALFK